MREGKTVIDSFQELVERKTSSLHFILFKKNRKFIWAKNLGNFQTNSMLNQALPAGNSRLDA